MFWRFGGYANISTLDSILDKPDVTVEELLEESDIIQELKQQNSKLIEFLRGDDVLQKLLDYVVAPKDSQVREGQNDDEVGAASRKGTTLDTLFGKNRARSRSSSNGKNESADEEDSKEEKLRLKYAYVSCEILSSDVWSISEAVLEHREALKKFWDYVRQPAPLDPVQASYFTKVNESLLDRKTEEVLELLKGLPDIVPDMLQHVDCPTMMDLLLKIISLERTDGGQGIVDWLQTQNLVPVLLAYLSPEHSSAIQTSAGDFLKAIITISANATTQDQNVIGPNELTRQLVSEPCVQVLIKEMLRGGNPLTVGVGIVIEVIRKNNSDYDLDNQIGPIPRSSDPIYLGTLLRQFAKSVPDFMHLILDPDHKVVASDGTVVTRKREMQAASGEKIEPLGFDRFKTCELMAELLHCSNMALLNDRGAEASVKERDLDRERLKAEGKLQPRAEEIENYQEAEFGTSVDSSGFHHARVPSDEAPEEIKQVDVSNVVEDEEFETVDALSEEIKGELDEALRSGFNTGTAHRGHGDVKPDGLQTSDSTVGDVHQISPLKPRRAENPSPFTGTERLAAKVDAIHIGEQTSSETTTEVSESLQSSVGSDDNSTITVPTNTSDTPAPLFAKASSPSEEAGKMNTADAHDSDLGDSSLTDLTERDIVASTVNEQSDSVMNDEDGQSQYVVDVDGSPVVGDLLKIMFVEHRVVPTILDFFFRFPWNNFLHNVVYDVVQQIFNGTLERGYNRHLADDLFQTGEITDRIIRGQEKSDESQTKNNMRLGYMGHLTLIAEEVVKFTEKFPPDMLARIVMEKVTSESWARYVDKTLAETRERDNAILGGVRPDMAVGPRQAVLNAVGAAQGGTFGGDAAGSLLDSGSTGESGVPLDSIGMTGHDNAGGFLFGSSGVGTGAGLLSGFNNSSDEEDDEVEEVTERDIHRAAAAGLTDDEQDELPDSSENLQPSLRHGPSRAQRRFQERLAQRKRAQENDQAVGEDADPNSGHDEREDSSGTTSLDTDSDEADDLHMANH